MLECRVHVTIRFGRQIKDLGDVDNIAHEQIESCEKHPIPRPADDASDLEFMYYIAFDACIRAEVTESFSGSESSCLDLTFFEGVHGLGVDPSYQSRTPRRKEGPIRVYRAEGRQAFPGVVRLPFLLECHAYIVTGTICSYLRAASWFPQGALPTRSNVTGRADDREIRLDDFMFARALWVGLAVQLEIGSVSLQGKLLSGAIHCFFLCFIPSLQQWTP